MTEATPVGPNLAYQNHLDGALVVTGAYVLFYLSDVPIGLSES